MPPEIRPFDRKVLAAIRRIPFGTTASYADVARAIGRPGAARAVGGALARNPLPLLLPCHRVIRANGEEGGYSGGAGNKMRMLEWESVRTRMIGEPQDFEGEREKA
jgi:O-6-methylguanine DNA methyltransferase